MPFPVLAAGAPSPTPPRAAPSRSGARPSAPCVKGGSPPGGGRPAPARRRCDRVRRDVFAGLDAGAPGLPEPAGLYRPLGCRQPLLADSRLLPAGQHHPCDKGTGLTSIVEGLNTKWRQRQSGLVRRSCGVHPRIGADLFERFRLLVDEHNRQSARQWQCRQDEDAAATQSNP